MFIISYFKNVVYFILSDITNWPKLVESIISSITKLGRHGETFPHIGRFIFCIVFNNFLF